MLAKWAFSINGQWTHVTFQTNILVILEYIFRILFFERSSTQLFWSTFEVIELQYLKLNLFRLKPPQTPKSNSCTEKLYSIKLNLFLLNISHFSYIFLLSDVIMALSFRFLLFQSVLLHVLFLLFFLGARYTRIPWFQSVPFHFFKTLGVYFNFPDISSLPLRWLFQSLNLLLVFSRKNLNANIKLCNLQSIIHSFI